MNNTKFVVYWFEKSETNPVKSIEFKPDGKIEKVTMWMPENGKWIPRVLRGNECELRIVLD